MFDDAASKSSPPDKAAEAIWAIIKPKLKTHTLSLPCLVLIEEHLTCCETGMACEGLGGGEITKRYNVLADEFGFTRYSDASTYVTRGTKERRLLFETASPGRYRIHSKLASSMQASSWDWLAHAIRCAIASFRSHKDAWIARLDECLALPPDDMDARIGLLQELVQTDGDKGQAFEIGVYAIMATYFARLGFELRRFSVTSSADGGMDFIAGTAIYQVSKGATRAKLESDYLKLPGTKRVFVGDRFPSSQPENPDVLELLDREQVVGHFLAWLVERDRQHGSAQRLDEAIQCARTQYARE